MDKNYEKEFSFYREQHLQKVDVKDLVAYCERLRLLNKKLEWRVLDCTKLLEQGAIQVKKVKVKYHRKGFFLGFFVGFIVCTFVAIALSL